MDSINAVREGKINFGSHVDPELRSAIRSRQNFANASSPEVDIARERFRWLEMRG
jgi:hypothetical protein